MAKTKRERLMDQVVKELKATFGIPVSIVGAGEAKFILRASKTSMDNFIRALRLLEWANEHRN